MITDADTTDTKMEPQPIPRAMMADLARRQAAAEKMALEFQRDWFKAFATVGESPENWTVTPDGTMIRKKTAVKEFPKAVQPPPQETGATAPVAKRKGGWPKGKPRKPKAETSADGKVGEPAT